MSTPPAALTTGSIPRHLVRLTLPMIGGILAMSAFNLTDAYFVAQLGTEALAAVSFTFPVVMVIASIAMGLGMSASILVSRAIGQGEHGQAKRLSTSSLLLAVVLVGLVGAAGILFMDPLFRLLGAGEEILPLIREYMTIWFACVWALVIPMVGNNCIRATGDTLTPGLIMIGLAGLNILLDPILIFGLGPIPPLGVFGAALASVLARIVGMVISLLLLVRRYDLVDWRCPRFGETVRQWAAAMHVALPSAATHLLMPVSMGFVTRLVAAYGHEAVAAIGAAGRVVHALYIVPMAIGSVLVPFSGQNWGGGRPDRVAAAWSLSNRFSLYYGLASVLLALPLAAPVARIFDDSAAFVWPFQAFLLLTLATSGLQHVGVHSGFILNAIGYPVAAFLYNAGRVFLLMCPLAWLGESWNGLTGIFAGVAASQALAGLGIRWALPSVIQPAREAVGKEVVKT